MFSFSDLQLLEQLAQYIKRRQFVIRMLLNKNGDPEFFGKMGTTDEMHYPKIS